MAENLTTTTPATTSEEDLDYGSIPVVAHRTVNDGKKNCEISEFTDELYKKLKNQTIHEGDCQEDRRNVTLYEVQVIPYGNKNLCMPPMYTLGPFKLNPRGNSTETCETVDEYHAGEECFCRLTGEENSDEKNQAECFCQIYKATQNGTRSTDPDDFYPYRRNCTLLEKQAYTETPYPDESIITNHTKWLSNCSLPTTPFEFESKYFEVPLSTVNASTTISGSTNTNSSSVETTENNSTATDSKKVPSKPSRNNKKSRKKGPPKPNRRRRPKVIIKIKEGTKITEAGKRKIAEKLKDLVKKKKIKIGKGDIKIVRTSGQKTNGKLSDGQKKTSKQSKKPTQEKKRTQRSAEFADGTIDDIGGQLPTPFLFETDEKTLLEPPSHLIPENESTYSTTNQHRKLLSLSHENMKLVKSDNLELQPLVYFMPIALAFAALFYLFSKLKKKMK